MKTVIIKHEAKCIHCDHFGSIKNGKRQQFNAWVDKNYIEVSIGHYVNRNGNQDYLYTTKELISIYSKR